MRIAVWHNLLSGGAKRALYDQVRELVRRGHYVEAWCPSTADLSYLPLRELIPEHVIPFEWQPRAHANRTTRFGAEYTEPIARLDALNRLWQQCAEEINRGEFDLLFANTCWMIRVAAVGRYVRFPKILYLQEPYRPFYEATPRLPWLALEPTPRWYTPRPLKNFLRDLLRVGSLEGYFDRTASSHDAEESKPDPDIVQVALKTIGLPASEVVLLGDTPYDVQAALQAGIAVIATTSALRPPAIATRAVWVTARDLSGGAPIAAADVVAVVREDIDTDQPVFSVGDGTTRRLFRRARLGKVQFLDITDTS